MRLFITGCAKSGTTLFRNLFYAFNSIKVIYVEIDYITFCKYNHKKIVGKRIAKSPFSFKLDKSDERYKTFYTDLLPKSKTLIINMVRDGRDVLESGVTCERWISCIKQSIDHQHLIDITVKYEELVTNPNKIQKELSKRYELEQEHLFSDYPKFMSKKVSKLFKDEYKPRVIDTSRVNKKFNYKEVVPLDLISQFEFYLRELNYLKS